MLKLIKQNENTYVINHDDYVYSIEAAIEGELISIECAIAVMEDLFRQPVGTEVCPLQHYEGIKSLKKAEEEAQAVIQTQKPQEDSNVAPVVQPHELQGYAAPILPLSPVQEESEELDINDEVVDAFREVLAEFGELEPEDAKEQPLERSLSGANGMLMSYHEARRASSPAIFEDDMVVIERCPWSI